MTVGYLYSAALPALFDAQGTETQAAAVFRAARRANLRHLCSRFRWVRWTNAASNPSLPWYRKIAAEFGGGEVGRLADGFMLGDGTLDDKIIFQIPGVRS